MRTNEKSLAAGAVIGRLFPGVGRERIPRFPRDL
jgi:hypothetical protein